MIFDDIFMDKKSNEELIGTRSNWELTGVNIASFHQHILCILGTDAVSAAGMHRVWSTLTVNIRIKRVLRHTMVDDVISFNSAI